MILWLVFAAMTLVAVALLAWPLLRRPRESAARAEHDIEIYRDQLAEIDRDVGRGVLSGDQADAARAEIGRRMLAAEDEAAAADPAPPRRLGTWPALASIAVAIPLFATLLYLDGGAPGVPSRPAAQNREFRAATEKESQETAALVARLARRLEQNGGDLKGWMLLARSLAQLERYSEAVAAFKRAVSLRPGDADLLSRYGEAMIFANQGTVTPQARKIFDAALAANRSQPRAHFYLGVADTQAGRIRQGLDRWLALEADSSPDAPWLPALRARIEQVVASLNLDLDDTRAAARAERGKPVDQSAAARGSDEARDTLIRSMVNRLATRLEESPDDAEGWLRLGRSYRVLGELDKSRDSYARAAKLRQDDVEVLGRYAGSLLSAPGPMGRHAAELDRVIGAIRRIDPKDRNGLWLAGLVAQRTGDRAKAASHWRKLLALLEPGSSEHDQLARRIKDLDGTK